MHHSHPLHAIVADVSGPGAALNVQQLAKLGILKLNGHERALVGELVHEREELGRQATVLKTG